MSIVQNPITGRTYGKFGTAIFSKNFQKNVMRSKPVEVRDAKTVPQLNQRQAFAAVQSYFKNRLPFVREVFLGMAVEKSAFSCAMQKNLPACLSGSDGAKIVNPAQIIWNEGVLSNLVNVELNTTTPGIVTITWDVIPAVLPDNGKDPVNFLLGGVNTDVSLCSIGAMNRNGGELVISVPEGEELNYTTVKHFVRGLKYKAGSELCSKVK